jgi:hypothetical protein
VKSIRYHRVVYITRDLNHIEPQQIIILPFLHEKRVYLNRQKNNTYYFYSSIDTPYSEIEFHNSETKKPLDHRLASESRMYEEAKLKRYQNERKI